MPKRRVLPLAAGLLVLPAAAQAEGMPQLNFANPLTLSQVWWGAIIFIVFFLLCWLWGLPQVAGVLERRAASIAADLDTARQSKLQADQSVAETTQAIARARAEAQGSINQALDAAKQRAAAQNAELNAKLEAQVAEIRIADPGGAAECVAGTANGGQRHGRHDRGAPDRQRRRSCAVGTRGGAGSCRPPRDLRSDGMEAGGFWTQSRTWVAIAFFLFFILFGKKLWAAVAGMLDSRADAVRRELAEAAQLREEAEQMLANARQEREQALTEAKALVEGAKAEAERVAAAAAEEARAAAHRREQMALDRIAAAEKAAVDEVRVTAAEVATVAARDVIAQGLSPDTDARLIDNSIARVPAALRAA